jgi:hypothetical protein
MDPSQSLVAMKLIMRVVSLSENVCALNDRLDHLRSTIFLGEIFCPSQFLFHRGIATLQLLLTSRVDFHKRVDFVSCPPKSVPDKACLMFEILNEAFPFPYLHFGVLASAKALCGPASDQSCLHLRIFLSHAKLHLINQNNHLRLTVQYQTSRTVPRQFSGGLVRLSHDTKLWIQLRH